MLKAGAIVKNWAYLLSSSMLSQILGLIAMIRVARILGPGEYGNYNLIQTTAGIGAVLAGFGMRNVIIRNCARNPEKAQDVLLTSLILRVGFWLIASAGIVLYSSNSKSALPFLLSGLIVLISFGLVIWDTAESISFGLQKMGLPSGINSLASVFWVILVWSTPAKMLTVVFVSSSFALIQIIKSGVFAFQVKQVVAIGAALKKREIKRDIRRLLMDSWPFYWLALLTMLTTMLPIIILAERSNSEQVGLFNVGFRLLNPLQLFIMTGLSVLYPYLSQAKTESGDRYMQAIEKALKIIVVFGSGCAFLVSMLRVEVVGILFGAKYAESAAAMAYQAWYTVLYAILCLIGTSLAASDKQRWLAALSTFYALVSLPIIWYSAKYGAKGLALGMALGALINLIYHWYVFQKSIPRKFPSGDVSFCLIVSFIAILCSLLIPSDLTMILRVIIAAIVILIMAIFLFREWKGAREPMSFLKVGNKDK